MDVGLPLGVAPALAVPDADAEPERVDEVLGEMVPLGVPACVFDPLASALDVPDALKVADELAVELRLGVRDSLALCEPDSEGVPVGLKVTPWVGVADPEPEPVPLGENDWLGVSAALAVALTDVLGVADCVAVPDAVAESEAVIVPDPLPERDELGVPLMLDVLV